MNATEWALADDLGRPATVVVLVLALSALVMLVLEVRSRPRGGWLVASTGLLGLSLFLAAVTRPARVAVRGTLVGPKIVVLLDQSRRLLIRAGTSTRRERAISAVQAIRKHYSGARVTVLGFGEGPAVPLDEGASRGSALTVESDLAAALGGLLDRSFERPQAVAVVSDGRLSAPGEGEVSREAIGRLGVPLHTVKVETRAPKDASIRSVQAAGAAVAHQPLALKIEVGCSGGLTCRSVPVTVYELVTGAERSVLASGEAKLEDGIGRVELEVTLDRAGARVLEVAIDAPSEDELAENNSRLMTFSVARDRVRLLHLAGRPTYDVRALRRWLKSDEAVDIVAFFILRESSRGEDDPHAGESELALIEFPVNELFTVHLRSFDAIILQDIDAIRYKLAQHLPALANYVESGGGLIMVGGPSSFAGGNYARTPLDAVLPVEQVASNEAYDPAPFTPAYTEAGREAPITRGLRDLVGEDLPTMHGANLLGAARPGSIVLWEHGRLMVGAVRMPILALGEAGDGRSIALAVDDTHQLAFGQFAAKVAGRGYGALWDGLLGWLMRDPKYEAARVELVHDCVAGEKTTLQVKRLPGMTGAVTGTLEQLGRPSPRPIPLEGSTSNGATVELPLPELAPGGYSVRVRIGAAPPTRHDFACERGGPAFSDSRPDPDRLERISKATGGRSVGFDQVESLPIPESTEVAAERHVSPLLPAWVWALAASLALGIHWVSRRQGGLA
jgi:uncharacterized membrane protein